MKRLIEKNAALLFSPAGFHGVITVLLVAVFLEKSLLFPGIGGDDGEQLIFAQYFDWGYAVRNPPLYTWLVIGAQEVFGVSALAVNAVKVALLWLLYWFLYRAGLYLFSDRRIAVAAALSPLLIFHIAWDSVLGFSHSVLAATLYAASLFAVLRLERDASALSYVWLGLALGCGVLSKYAFVFFAIALIAACLSDGALRKRILDPKILIALLVAAAVPTPHLSWLYERHAALAGEIAPALSDAGVAAHLLAAGKGVLSGLKAIVGFLLPLLVFLAAFFPGAWRHIGQSATPQQRRHHCFLAIFLIVLIGSMFLFIAVGGVSRVRTHYMYVMVLAPLLFFLRVEIAAVRESRLRGYGAVLSLAALVVVIGLPVKYVAEPWFCGKCEHHVPYDDFAEKLRKAGFETGTIFAYWHPYPIAGNLRIAFPKARTISAKHAAVRPPPGPPSEPAGQCLLAWSGPPRGAEAGNTIGLANRTLDSGIAPGTPGTALRSRLSWGTKRPFALSYILLEKGRGGCR